MTFLRCIFGPSKEEIWRQFCAATGGQYLPAGFWKGDKVEARHGQCMICFQKRWMNYAG